MHDIRRLGLQVFAAPNNMTGEAQIHVEAREIDFVTSGNYQNDQEGKQFGIKDQNGKR